MVGWRGRSKPLTHPPGTIPMLSPRFNADLHPTPHPLHSHSDPPPAWPETHAFYTPSPHPRLGGRHLLKLSSTSLSSWPPRYVSCLPRRVRTRAEEIRATAGQVLGFGFGFAHYDFLSVPRRSRYRAVGAPCLARVDCGNIFLAPNSRHYLETLTAMSATPPSPSLSSPPSLVLF